MEERNIAEFAMKKCEEIGADESEAFVQSQKGFEIVLERGEIQSERSKSRHGIGVRFIRDKKIGFAYSSILKRKDVERTCRSALRLTNTLHANSKWTSLPMPMVTAKPLIGTYDKEIECLTAEEAIGFVSQGYDAVKKTGEQAVIDDGKFSAYTIEIALVNSSGINLEEKGTIISFSLTCVAKDGAESSSFAYEYEVSRNLKGFSAKRVGEIAAKKALASLNAQKVESFKGQLLMHPDVAAEILFSPVSSSVNGENVQRRRSIWKDKIGEEVASKNLSIVDDGLLPYGLASSSFDAEGVPCQKTVLLDKGVLQGFLYDSYTANIMGVTSTGNASRRDYASLPSVSISNLTIKKGNKRIESIVSGIDRGLVVSRFSGNVNPQNGDFSGLVKQANYIENGRVEYPLRETMISGNAFEMLNGIVEIGEETRPTMMSVYCPPILVKEVTVLAK